MCTHSLFFFFKQKTAYEMRISDWSSDVCSSDLIVDQGDGPMPLPQAGGESHSTPLVLGIVSPLRGSISTAWRSARASDLYMLSAIWWLFSPYRVSMRSEEHTSELQSLMRISYAVFCLKKKQKITDIHNKQATSSTLY